MVLPAAIPHTFPPAQTADVIVVATGSRPRFTSGVLATYLAVTARLHHGGNAVFLLPWLSPDEAVPKVGDRCRFRFSWIDHPGEVGAAGDSVARARVIRKMDCR